MKATCPHCGHDLTVDSLPPGSLLKCPACNGTFTLPMATPFVSSVPRAARPSGNAGGGGFGKGLLLLAAVAAVAFGFGMYYYNESPEQLWQRLTAAAHKLAAPASTASPSSTPTSPAPTEVEPVVETPQPTPTPPPDPIAWILEHKAQWPKEVRLKESMEFPVVINGQTAGTAKVPEGTKVALNHIEVDSITTTYGNGTRQVPISATDLKEQASMALLKAGLEAKAQAPTPSPSAESTAPSVLAYIPADRPTAVVDDIMFGDDRSEQKHGVKAERSQSYKGALEQPARRFLPGGPLPWEGGSVEWTMKVDPQAQIYLTVKLWGSEKGHDLGRLILFANGLQVGYRHEGDYDYLNQCDDDALALGRFVYVTVMLPPKLTQGKTTLNLKLLATGPIWPYGSNFEQYQKPLTQPSRGVYRAYTHTTARFAPGVAERQGEAPAGRVRTKAPKVIADSKQIVIDSLTRRLAASKAPAGNPKGRLAELVLLSEAYNIPWTPAYQDARALDQIVRDGDALADDCARDAKCVESDWSGMGPLGQAVMQTWPAIGKQMDAKITAGSSEMPRGKAWAKALHASVEYWRTHRRAYTNQSMIVDANIYSANRALQLLEPSLALPEAKALHYIYEATGIEPWVGSDMPSGGSEKPYGAHYALLSRKGISRELGYVGTYGETILRFTRDMAVLTGDAKLREQYRKMQRARLYFRYPSFDADGYRCMKLVSEIDNRTAHYPVSGPAYLSPNVRELWGMEAAAMIPEDPVIVGAAQQSVADGQYFSYVEGRLKEGDILGMMKNVDDWEKASKLPPSPRKIPMTPGEPDFAFADEENAVLAIKQGETRLFVNLYYRAERGVNRVARIFELTPNITRIATTRSDVEVISSGETYERPDWIDRVRNIGHPPPGQQLHQAWAGEKLPISKRPEDAPSPKYGDWGPFLGKAAFYRLQYGDYLIAMNTTENRTYSLPAPSGCRRAPELISGKEIDWISDVKVPPMTTLVVYLGKSKTAAP